MLLDMILQHAEKQAVDAAAAAADAAAAAAEAQRKAGTREWVRVIE
jgi:hypothetical protein